MLISTKTARKISAVERDPLSNSCVIFQMYVEENAAKGKQPSSANTSNKQRSAKDPFWFLMLINTKTARKFSAVEKSGTL